MMKDPEKLSALLLEIKGGQNCSRVVQGHANQPIYSLQLY